MRELTEEKPVVGKSRCVEGMKEAMEIQACMNPSKNIFNSCVRLLMRTGSSALGVMGLIALAGCSSSSVTSAPPQVGSIAFTDVNGTVPSMNAKVPTSLTVNQGTYLYVALPSDPKLLGADWTAYCGSQLPPGAPLPPGQIQDLSCGTFTPGHTLGGPPPSYAASGAGYVTFYTAPAVPPKQGTVTLYASATSDPTKFTSVTLTILGLPISVGFAPPPPSSLGLSTATPLKAVLTNDASSAGVKWSVICGSPACGAFSQTQTASGVVTTYTSPASVPIGGSVQVTATSVADPTKSITATIPILPISVSVLPPTLSVATAGTGTVIATVANDGLKKGVDWTVSCTNAVKAGTCGTITPHTSSGATAMYTAPGLANIAAGTMVTLTAASTTDPTAKATSSVMTITGNLVSGTLQAAQRPVTGAAISLYAAQTGSKSVRSLANNAGSVVTTATTDGQGNFEIPYGYECPAPDAQMYVVSTGGDAGGGLNQSLSLMAALGDCAKLDTSHVVVNEATTTAAVYALSSYMPDAVHVGSANASASGVASAFETAKDLVDVTTGTVRITTLSNEGVVPQAKINTLANLLSMCAKTSGSAESEENACSQLFRATGVQAASSQPVNTIQALLGLSRNATGFAGHADSFAWLYRLATQSSAYSPALSTEPSDWLLDIQFPDSETGAVPAMLSIDSAGNVWMRRGSHAATEFVGAASVSNKLKARIQSGETTQNIP